MSMGGERRVDPPEPAHDPGASDQPTDVHERAGEAIDELLPSIDLLPSHGRLRQVLHGLGLIEQAIGAALIVVILALVLTQAFQRYLPGAGWAWTGEVARLSLVWCTLILCGYLMAQDRHITIKVVDLLLRGRALGLIKLMTHLVVLATCLAMTYASYRLIADDIGQRTPAAGIPLALIYVVPMVGFALTALRAILAIGVLDVPQIRNGEEEASS